MEYLCNDCPRRCGALRNDLRPAGVCRSYASPALVRAAAHFGEEPCISGTRGSGTIFFSGCSLGCIFCQNREISREARGKRVTPEELRDIMLRLEATGVHNISLVTASHHVPAVARALEGAGLKVPVVWNSSGYESVETLRRLEGLVQVWLPDLKYLKSDAARRYSGAADYPEAAQAAIKEMFRQAGPYVMDEEGLLQRGVLIRHLLLPGQEQNTMEVIDWVAEEFPQGQVLFSLMSQYTPLYPAEALPEELRQPVSPELADWMRDYMERRGIENGYWQETSSATEEMLPAFDGTGL